MTATLSDEYHPFTKEVAQACAITFHGNTSNGLQQDAFSFLDHWYQENLGIMPVTSVLNVIQMNEERATVSWCL